MHTSKYLKIELNLKCFSISQKCQVQLIDEIRDFFQEKAKLFLIFRLRFERIFFFVWEIKVVLNKDSLILLFGFRGRMIYVPLKWDSEIVLWNFNLFSLA